MIGIKWDNINNILLQQTSKHKLIDNINDSHIYTIVTLVTSQSTISHG